MSIKAVAHISQVRGGSQARIMLADDGKKYVVKFQGNPQCTRVLANDYLACRLARMIGLSVPEPVIILVDEKTILEQQIAFTLAGRRCSASGASVWFCLGDRPRLGLAVRDQCLGGSGISGNLLACWPSTSGPAMPMADRWYSTRRCVERKYNAKFIDFGYCFNAGEWSFPDAPLRGVYGLNDVWWENKGIGESADSVWRTVQQLRPSTSATTVEGHDEPMASATESPAMTIENVPALPLRKLSFCHANPRKTVESGQMPLSES